MLWLLGDRSNCSCAFAPTLERATSWCCHGCVQEKEKGREVEITKLPGAGGELSAAYGDSASGSSATGSDGLSITMSLLGDLLLAPVAPLFADMPEGVSGRSRLGLQGGWARLGSSVAPRHEQ